MKCNAAPIAHKYFETATFSLKNAEDKSKRLIEIVGKNANFTGWENSAATCSRKKINFVANTIVKIAKSATVAIKKNRDAAGICKTAAAFWCAIVNPDIPKITEKNDTGKFFTRQSLITFFGKKVVPKTGHFPF